MSSQINFFADDVDQQALLLAADDAGALAVAPVRHDEADVRLVSPLQASSVARGRSVYLLPGELIELAEILHDHPIAGTDFEMITADTSPVIELLLSGEEAGLVPRGRLYIDVSDSLYAKDVRRLYRKLVGVVRCWPRVPSLTWAHVGSDTDRRVRAGALRLRDPELEHKLGTQHPE